MNYFTFEIDGKPVGYYEEEDVDGVFYCNARMVINGETFFNPYWIQHENGRPIAYRVDDGPFIPFDQPHDVFPAAAVPLILAAMGDRDTFTYRVWSEHEGQVTSTAVLTRDGHTITESINGAPQRTFLLQDGQVVAYGWGGGAHSQRVDSAAVAKAGTPFA